MRLLFVALGLPPSHFMSLPSLASFKPFVSCFAEAFIRDGARFQNVLVPIRAATGLTVPLHAQIYPLGLYYPTATTIKPCADALKNPRAGKNHDPPAPFVTPLGLDLSVRGRPPHGHRYVCSAREILRRMTRISQVCTTPGLHGDAGEGSQDYFPRSRRGRGQRHHNVTASRSRERDDDCNSDTGTGRGREISSDKHDGGGLAHREKPRQRQSGGEAGRE